MNWMVLASQVVVDVPSSPVDPNSTLPCAGREVRMGQSACLPVLGGHGGKRAARLARRHSRGLASRGAGFLTPHPEVAVCRAPRLEDEDGEQDDDDDQCAQSDVHSAHVPTATRWHAGAMRRD